MARQQVKNHNDTTSELKPGHAERKASPRMRLALHWRATLS